MKLGSPPPPPPGDATDPLLAALRQRLGDYGQAPPPGAWAAIRQQLGPVAPPRPWWRRPRRLLPLLGLLLGWLLPGMLGEPLEPASLSGWPTGSPVATPPLSRRPAATPAAAEPIAAPRRHSSALASAVRPAAPYHAPHDTAANRGTVGKAAAALVTRADSRLLSRLTASKTAQQRSTRAMPSATNPLAAAPAASAAALATQARHRPAGLVVADNSRRMSSSNRLNPLRSASRNKVTQPAIATEASVAEGAIAARLSGRRARGKSLTLQAAAAAGYVEAYHHAAANRLALANQSLSRTRSTTRQPAQPGRRSAAQAATQAASFARADTAAAEATRPLARRAHSTLPEPVDLLALKQTSLLLPASALPAALAARPDSTTSAPHPARRWALLVVAGPTLSYRTLGPAPTLAAGHPDFARLERPALGLGAQVQVRRVLSGRWALAVGVGYHEYATRLALSLKDTAGVHQRDTYRLLTVPVQLSYVLGASRGRLTKALLLGTEPGWYVGGRSTEGADCGCHQQTYSATGSPYRTWNLAFSLGLDLRYRVGGADSRWQWLVQPTGRYVATPFVRSDAVGFTRRQPWSLGLMTGFSWDVR